MDDSPARPVAHTQAYVCPDHGLLSYVKPAEYADDLKLCPIAIGSMGDRCEQVCRGPIELIPVSDHEAEMAHLSAQANRLAGQVMDLLREFAPQRIVAETLARKARESFHAAGITEDEADELIEFARNKGRELAEKREARDA